MPNYSDFNAELPAENVKLIQTFLEKLKEKLVEFKDETL